MVIGVIALLMAIVAPMLLLAQRQAKRTRCAANLQQIGYALEITHDNFDEFYPYWDDGGTPIRYTWIDLLAQVFSLGNRAAGYCPEDGRPDPVNMARAAVSNIYYPGRAPLRGMDYSYGISRLLSAGSWAGQPFSDPGACRTVFDDHNRDQTRRVLAADGYWSSLYNLSGDANQTGIWNWPTQYDNTVAWRHRGFVANLLMQDLHVVSVRYQLGDPTRAVDTTRYCMWYPGESIYVGPGSANQGTCYPDQPPFIFQNGEVLGNIFPPQLVPGYYTYHNLWSQVPDKGQQ